MQTSRARDASSVVRILLWRCNNDLGKHGRTGARKFASNELSKLTRGLERVGKRQHDPAGWRSKYRLKAHRNAGLRDPDSDDKGEEKRRRLKRTGRRESQAPTRSPQGPSPQQHLHGSARQQALACDRAGAWSVGPGHERSLGNDGRVRSHRRAGGRRAGLRCASVRSSRLSNGLAIRWAERLRTATVNAALQSLFATSTRSPVARRPQRKLLRRSAAPPPTSRGAMFTNPELDVSEAAGKQVVRGISDRHGDSH